MRSSNRILWDFQIKVKTIKLGQSNKKQREDEKHKEKKWLKSMDKELYHKVSEGDIPAQQ